MLLQIEVTPIEDTHLHVIIDKVLYKDILTECELDWLVNYICVLKKK